MGNTCSSSYVKHSRDNSFGSLPKITVELHSEWCWMSQNTHKYKRESNIWSDIFLEKTGAKFLRWLIRLQDVIVYFRSSILKKKKHIHIIIQLFLKTTYTDFIHPVFLIITVFTENLIFPGFINNFSHLWGFCTLVFKAGKSS